MIGQGFGSVVKKANIFAPVFPRGGGSHVEGGIKIAIFDQHTSIFINTVHDMAIVTKEDILRPIMITTKKLHTPYQ